MASTLQRTTVTIASGATASAAVSVPQDCTLVAVGTPAALTGTSFTFEVSDDDGTTYKPLYNGSTQYSVTVGTSRHIALDATATRSVLGGPAAAPTWMKVISGSAEGASRNITLIFAQV